MQLSEMRIFKIMNFFFLKYYVKLTIVQRTLHIFICVLFHNNILDFEAPICDWGKSYLKTVLPLEPGSSAFLKFNYKISVYGQKKGS